MQGLTAWIAKLIKGLGSAQSATGTTPPTSIIPTPVAPSPQTPPTPAGPPKKSEIDLALGDYSGRIGVLQQQNDAARQRMQAPAPTRETQPIADTLGGLAALFTQNPTASSNAAGFGRREADRIFGGQQEAWKVNYDQAAQEEESTRALLGEYLTAQGAIDRVRSLITKTNLDNESKLTIARLKADTTFRTKLADLYGKGEATPDGIAQMLIGLGYTGDLATKMGQDIYKDIADNPSYALGLKREHLELEQKKAQQAEYEGLQKIVSAEGSTFGQRLSAITKLRDLGDPFYGSLDPEQLEIVASKESLLQARLRHSVDFEKARASKEQAEASVWKTMTNARIASYGRDSEIAALRYLLSEKQYSLAESRYEREIWDAERKADQERATIIIRESIGYVDEEIKAVRESLKVAGALGDSILPDDDDDVVRLKTELRGLKLAKRKLIDDLAKQLNLIQQRPQPQRQQGPSYSPMPRSSGVQIAPQPVRDKPPIPRASARAGVREDPLDILDKPPKSVGTKAGGGKK